MLLTQESQRRKGTTPGRSLEPGLLLERPPQQQRHRDLRQKQCRCRQGRSRRRPICYCSAFCLPAWLGYIKAVIQDFGFENSSCRTKRLATKNTFV